MFVLMIYVKSREEQNVLKEICRDAVAHLSEEQMELLCAERPIEVKKVLEEGQLLDFAFMEVSDDTDIRLLHETRNSFSQSEMLLLADAEISPMQYLTPGVRAMSLLLRPFSREQCRRAVWEFLETVLGQREGLKKEKLLVVQDRSGKVVIPFQKIYYIEARERKVFVRLRDREYCEYGKLGNLKEILPDTFLQCHRSFVFNTEHLKNVKLSEGTVCLENGLVIPVSRGYRKKVKEFLNERRGR